MSKSARPPLQVYLRQRGENVGAASTRDRKAEVHVLVDLVLKRCCAPGYEVLDHEAVAAAVLDALKVRSTLKAKVIEKLRGYYEERRKKGLSPCGT